MKKVIVVLLVGILSACGWHETDVKTEKGVVLEKQWHQPALDATGYSVNTKGDVAIHTLRDVEKFLVMFKCEHGIVFSVNKPKVYAKVEKGDTVVIEYTEMLNGDGKVMDIHFKDANKVLK